jgi:hypothetical protein
VAAQAVQLPGAKRELGNNLIQGAAVESGDIIIGLHVDFWCYPKLICER